MKDDVETIRGGGNLPDAGRRQLRARRWHTRLSPAGVDAIIVDPSGSFRPNIEAPMLEAMPARAGRKRLDGLMRQAPNGGDDQGDTGDDGLGIYDPAFVKGVFDRCSAKYIAFSWLCSFGFTARWRRQCTAALELGSAPVSTGYDLMAGTGGAWPHLLAAYPQIGSITAVDISTGMHERAIARRHRHRAHRIDFIEDDALKSRLPAASADFVISTFGLKTFNADQHRQLAALIARTLKPGGRFSLIEASDPKGWWLRPLYLFYLYRVLPLVERFLLRGAQDFSMIGEYCDHFGDAEAFAGMLRAEGLEVRYRRYVFGCATGVSGWRPAG